MTVLRSALILLTCLAGSLIAAETPAHQHFAFESGGHKLRVWYHRPAAATADAPVLFVIHGVGRNAEEYLADWIEVTNTGAGSVSLTGWRFDDSSALFSSAVELVGVPILPAGASAIFYEGTDDAAFELAFAQAWFGQNLFDSGTFFGHYTGGGVGMSTGGDGATWASFTLVGSKHTLAVKVTCNARGKLVDATLRPVG